MKPGYKTTEFWLSLLAMVVGTLMAAGVFGDSSMGMRVLTLIAGLLGGLGYTVSRGMSKKGLAILEAAAKLKDPS